MASPSPSVTKTGSVRIQPTRPTPGPTKTNLSITDATVATLGAATALWVFQRNHHTQHNDEVNLLKESLAHTLSFYPHFAGQLNLTSWPPGGGGSVPHTERFRRCFITHGFPEDPGVELQSASIPLTAIALFPDLAARRSTHLIWDQTEAGFYELFSPDGKFSVNALSSGDSEPAVLIRATMLECSSVVIVPRFVHPLADAETMISFMKAWGRVHVALSRNEPTPSIECVFDPALLDAKSSGQIDAQDPDPELIQQSLALPLPRYDWWEHVPGNPARLDDSPQVVVPQHLPESVRNSRIRGQQIPWDDWDFTVDVTHKVFHLTGSEIGSLYEEVTQKVDPAIARVSQHDVILAIIWQLTALAKPPERELSLDQTTDETEISLDTTLGLRPRLGLPQSFVGSPILLAGLSAPYSQVTGLRATRSDTQDIAAKSRGISFPNIEALAVTASLIRRHLSKFDSNALGAWLHEQAFEIAPQRWWNGFLGSKHTMATSWIRAGLWEVDFGFGTDFASYGAASPSRSTSLRWAGVIGPKLDGLVTLLEADRSFGRDWLKAGVDVDMKLESAATSRVVELLQSWREHSRSIHSGVSWRDGASCSE